MIEKSTLISEHKSERKINKGLIAAGVLALGGFGLVAASIPFVTPALRRICIPYVPATNTQVENVLLALKGRSGKVIDLGSGDGRIVFESARLGFHSTGVELNPWLVLYSKLKARYLGIHNLAKFHRINLWKVNLNNYENIIIFGVNEMIPELERKLLKELNENKHYSVIACRFPLRTFTHQQVIGSGIDTVWIYRF